MNILSESLSSEEIEWNTHNRSLICILCISDAEDAVAGDGGGAI